LLDGAAYEGVVKGLLDVRIHTGMVQGAGDNQMALPPGSSHPPWQT
jgi:hypothetical protein